MPTILLTGATGYIGSHTWLALHEAGFDVVGVDNFANSSPVVLERLGELMGATPVFEQADVTDQDRLSDVLARRPVDAVVHFAAHKAVGESVRKPLEYYRNNIGGLVNLAQVMKKHGVSRLVFSSSATVYGQPQTLPIREDAPLSATNPYGTTKLVGEQLLRELARCEATWRISYLRYFNPVGAHPSGRIGEDPRGEPNNLMPYVTQVAVGTREFLRVFGSDYDTPDGTGVRDYIHVIDLALGHVAALRHLLAGGESHTVNLGTGQGYSVLEVVRAFEAASGRAVPFRIAMWPPVMPMFPLRDNC
jgi:UDP-glucose 4-epimerase